MKLSVVTTMYYSRNYLQEFYKRTLSVIRELGISYEFIFVDDGSPDDSLLVALQLQSSDQKIKVVELSRNFGHQRAIMTGLLHASGDYVFLIDCDLEESPELLKEFWSKMVNQEKIDVVYGVQQKRKGEWVERISGRLFYKLLSALSPVEYPADTTTARVMTRKYVDSIVRFSEKELDLWGIFALAGFNRGFEFVKRHRYAPCRVGSSATSCPSRFHYSPDFLRRHDVTPYALLLVLAIMFVLFVMVAMEDGSSLREGVMTRQSRPAAWWRCSSRSARSSSWDGRSSRL